jgi:hypothetical protein
VLTTLLSSRVSECVMTTLLSSRVSECVLTTLLSSRVSECVLTTLLSSRVSECVLTTRSIHRTIYMVVGLLVAPLPSACCRYRLCGPCCGHPIPQHHSTGEHTLEWEGDIDWIGGEWTIQRTI